MALTFYNPNQGNPFFEAMNRARMKSPDEIREEALKLNIKQTKPYLNDLSLEFNQDAKNVSLMRNDENKFVFGGTKGKQGDLLTEWKNYKELMGEGAVFNDFRSLYDTGTAQVDSAKVASINKYITDESLRGVSETRIKRQFQSPEINAFISRLQRDNPELYNTLLLPSTITDKIGLGEKLGQFIEDHPLLATTGALAAGGGAILGGRTLLGGFGRKGSKAAIDAVKKITGPGGQLPGATRFLQEPKLMNVIKTSGPGAAVMKQVQTLIDRGDTKAAQKILQRFKGKSGYKFIDDIDIKNLRPKGVGIPKGPAPKSPIPAGGRFSKTNLIKGAKTLGKGVLGSIVGGGIGYGVGSAVGGEKGGRIGEIAGGTAGIYALPKMWDTISKKVAKKGMPWAMKRIAQKGGPALLARVAAKAGAAGIGGAFSGGLATALMAGFIATDLYQIANILAEEE